MTDNVDSDPALTWFEALFAANYDDLLRFAARRVGTEAAPDVVAEVFLVAWRRRGEIGRQEARLWLFGVARRLAANEQRGQLRRARLVERVRNEPITSVTDADPVAAADSLRMVLATLPPLEQEALRLTEWDGLNVAEAAVVAGCSRGTFRVRLHRARRHLATGLGREMSE